MTRISPPLTAISTAALTVLALAGCTPNNPPDQAGGPLTVTSTATECSVSASSAGSGPLTFRVTNKGENVTEFYLLADDGLRIISEVENIGPGITRDLVLNATPGSYYTVCKPGMVGEGVARAAFTVTDSGTPVAAAGDEQEQIQKATVNYKAYVKDQTDQLLTGTQEFAKAFMEGRDDDARQLYPVVRMHFERIEPVAESFGDLDPKLDRREADLAPGEVWTGWHRAEKNLWPPQGTSYAPLDQAARAALAEQLIADTVTLRESVAPLELTLDQIANGAIGLMDEVASGKVTGEEEFWSHTDLWDFRANVEGAKVMYEGVRDLLMARDPELVKTLDAKFDELMAELDKHRLSPEQAAQRDIRYTLYNELTPEEIRPLSDKVNALGEPLSRITATLLG